MRDWFATWPACTPMSTSTMPAMSPASVRPSDEQHHVAGQRHDDRREDRALTAPPIRQAPDEGRRAPRSPRRAGRTCRRHSSRSGTAASCSRNTSVVHSAAKQKNSRPARSAASRRTGCSRARSATDRMSFVHDSDTCGGLSGNAMRITIGETDHQHRRRPVDGAPAERGAEARR